MGATSSFIVSGCKSHDEPHVTARIWLLTGSHGHLSPRLTLKAGRMVGDREAFEALGKFMGLFDQMVRYPFPTIWRRLRAGFVHTICGPKSKAWRHYGSTQPSFATKSSTARSG
jgi:hypothetical protein